MDTHDLGADFLSKLVCEGDVVALARHRDAGGHVRDERRVFAQAGVVGGHAAVQAGCVCRGALYQTIGWC